jgi:hypothetical protein
MKTIGESVEVDIYKYPAIDAQQAAGRVWVGQGDV